MKSMNKTTSVKAGEVNLTRN